MTDVDADYDHEYPPGVPVRERLSSALPLAVLLCSREPEVDG